MMPSRSLSTWRLWPTLLLTMGLAAPLPACTGEIESGGTDAGAPDIGGNEEDAEAPMPRFHFEAEGEDLRPGIRRLTSSQLENSYFAITGVRVDLSALADPERQSLRNDASQLLVRDAAMMREIYRAATEAASQSDLDTFLACDGSCSADELRAFLENAFVLPVGDAELAEYSAIYDDASGRVDELFGRRAFMQAALLSHHVIYRTEVGEDGRLTSFELAERLSYFLWNEPPDETLAALAFDGTILEDSVYDAQVERLLADPRSGERMIAFVFDWLGLDHVDLSHLQGGDELPAGIIDSMETEVRRMLQFAYDDSDTGFRDLITWDHTTVDAALAAHYGLAFDEAGETWQEVSLEGSERLGLLTTALVLAAHAKEGGRSPMQRGKFLVDELLCYGFPPDAGDAAMTLPADMDSLTFREKFGTLEQRSDCNKCHRMINAGFAFDIFDNVGRRWDEDFVGLEDATGSFELAPYPAFSFESTSEAIEGIAAHPALGRCFSAQLFRFAQGTVPGADDGELLGALESDYDTTAGNLRSALQIILSSARFQAPAN